MTFARGEALESRWSDGTSRAHPASPPAGLWPSAALRMLLAVNVVGVAALVLAHGIADNTANLSHQVVWLNVSVVSLAVIAAADACWLIVGRRAVGRYRHWLLPSSPRAADGRPAARPGLESNLVYVPGTTRAHRPNCLLVIGKPTMAAAEDDSHELCEVCGAQRDG